MKVRIFTGSDSYAIERMINEWLGDDVDVVSMTQSESLIREEEGKGECWSLTISILYRIK